MNEIPTNASIVDSIHF